MKPALEATDLEHVFQSVVSGDDVYRGRPDPEAYLYAAQQLGRPSVRCVVIGNSNQVRAGGCAVILALRRTVPSCRALALRHVLTPSLCPLRPCETVSCLWSQIIPKEAGAICSLQRLCGVSRSQVVAVS